MPNPNPNPNPNPIIDSHHVNQTLPSSSPKPNTKILSIFLKFSIMSIILSLFLLFIGLAAILLLHLLLVGSFLHRRRRHLPRATSSFSTHLPSFTYKARDQQPSSSSSSLNNDCCCICLEYYNEGESCRVIPVCEHVFHARCVDTWLVKVPSCPVCRTRVRFGSHGSSSSSDLLDSEYDDENKFLWGIGVGR